MFKLGQRVFIPVITASGWNGFGGRFQGLSLVQKHLGLVLQTPSHSRRGLGARAKIGKVYFEIGSPGCPPPSVFRGQARLI